MIEAAIEAIQQAYSWVDKVPLSVTGFLVALGLFALALLFSVREAASWFFKIDDVKRDVKRLRKSVMSLEGEIRVLQTLLQQAQPQTINQAPAPTPAPDSDAAEKDREAVAAQATPITQASIHQPSTLPHSATQASGEPKAPHFPIAH